MTVTATLSREQFTQTDPQPLGAGSPFESAYVYAGNDPTVYTDPSGLRKVQKPCKAPDWRQTLRLYGKALTNGSFSDCEKLQGRAVVGVHEQYIQGGNATTSAATTIAIGATENPITGPVVGGAVLVGVGVGATIYTAVKVGDLVEELTKEKERGLRRIYQDNPKHGAVARFLGGVEVSRRPHGGPADWQAILDRSVPDGPIHGRGVEPDTGLPVILQRHLIQEFPTEDVEYFHGYVPGG
jgi:hypothetical protein